MKILVLSPFIPYPLDQGGKIRVFNIVANLARRHSVTLAAIAGSPAAEPPQALRDLGVEVVILERAATPWRDLFSFVAGAAPFNAIRFRSTKAAAMLGELAERQRFDLVQIEFSLLWQYAGIFLARGIPVALDAHNVEYRIVRQNGEKRGNPLCRLPYRVEERRLRRLDEKAWRECSLCFAVSEPERREIAAVGGEAKAVVIPNGVDLGRFAFLPREGNGRKLLFLGGMDYLPNLDSACWFLQEIFPLIRVSMPEVSADVVGRELNRIPERLVGQPGLSCHESVAEVLPFFREADLLAVPLRLGAGTRIKILEAMAAGLPVVSTSKGCEGIDAEDGIHLLKRDTPQAFAEAVERLLKDPELGRSLAVNARLLVEQKYSWETLAAKLEERYRLLPAAGSGNEEGSSL